MDVDFSGKRLGKVPAQPDSRVPLMLSLVGETDPMAPPDAQNWYSSVAAWPMDNDTQPDCTAAAVAHAIQQWTVYGQNMSIIMRPPEVLSFFQATKAPGGDGAYLTDVMRYWMTSGVQTGFGLHKILAYASIDPSSPLHVKCGMAWFGNVTVGLRLPISAQSQDMWTVVPGPASGVGSWGGHCVLCVGYDAESVFFVSWGRVMQMTWDFFTTYCDEAYVALTYDFLKPPGNAPSGLSLDLLRQRLKALKSTS